MKTKCTQSTGPSKVILYCWSSCHVIEYNEREAWCVLYAIVCKGGIAGISAVWIRLSPSEGRCMHMCICRTTNRNSLWLAKVFYQKLDFPKASKQSQMEVQRSVFLSDHLNYNMLKGYHDFFLGSITPKKYAAYSTIKTLWKVTIWKIWL